MALARRHRNRFRKDHVLSVIASPAVPVRRNMVQTVVCSSARGMDIKASTDRLSSRRIYFVEALRTARLYLLVGLNIP